MLVLTLLVRDTLVVRDLVLVTLLVREGDLDLVKLTVLHRVIVLVTDPLVLKVVITDAAGGALSPAGRCVLDPVLDTLLVRDTLVVRDLVLVTLLVREGDLDLVRLAVLHRVIEAIKDLLVRDTLVVRDLVLVTLLVREGDLVLVTLLVRDLVLVTLVVRDLLLTAVVEGRPQAREANMRISKNTVILIVRFL